MMSFLKNDSSNSLVFNFPAVLRGTVIALIVSILGAAALGLVFYFSNLSEKIMPLAAVGVLFLSVFIGGLLAAYNAGNRGIYHGLAVGFAFFVASWLLVVLFFPGNTVFLSVLQKFLVTAIAGGLGGILGVGLSS